MTKRTKELKEQPLFDDDLLNEIEDTGVCICRPICKNCAIKVIEIFMQQFPGVNITLTYNREGMYTLVATLPL